jgi:hypothetical protein
MNVTTTPVLLVGSLPYHSAEESFREVSRSLSGKIGWIPDGEFGERINWTAMLPEFVFSKHRDLEEIVAPPTRTVERAPVSDAPIPSDMDGFWTFRIKPGHRLKFEELLYGRIAVESYGVFRRLRDEGVIPADVRFQVCLPSPHSSTDPYFEDRDQWPEVYAAYLDGLRREIEKIVAVVPARDLVFQWDCAGEIVDLTMGERNAMKWYPKLTVEEKFERHASQLGDLGDSIPEDSALGFHWCCGTWGGWPSVAMTDLSDCVRLSNEAVARVARRVDYVHMPVMPQPDHAFFAPLRDLATGDTRIFLGLVHHTDTIDDFRRRRDMARKYLPEFGIGSVCGYGRVDPAEARAVLDLHAANAAELRVSP